MTTSCARFTDHSAVHKLSPRDQCSSLFQAINQDVQLLIENVRDLSAFTAIKEAWLLEDLQLYFQIEKLTSRIEKSQEGINLKMIAMLVK